MRAAVVLALLLAAGPARAELVRGPYVQLTTRDATTVVWRTDGPRAGRVRYGLAPDALAETVSATAAATQHEVRLTGLQPGTRYCYAVEDDAGRLAGGDPAHCFRTAPEGKPPFTFWVVGDSGTGSGKQGRVRDAMWIQRQGILPDVYLHVGDMAYSEGTDDEFQRKFFAMYPRVLAQVPAFPAIGNHEGTSSDSLTGTGPYYEAYVLPTRGEAGGLASGTEAYYAWDWGDVHFVALESHRAELRAEGSAMLQWLELDLAASDARWLVVCFHHPPYTKGSHDSDTEVAHIEMRARVMPILEAHGVDLVLGGHSHIYERSYLLHGAYETPSVRGEHVLDPGDGRGEAPYHRAAGSDGAIYVVAGHGGTNVGGPGGHPLMAFTELANGSVLVDVDGPALRIRNVRMDGVVTDDLRFLKGEVLHLTGPDGPLVAGAPAEVTWLSRGGPRTVDLELSLDAGATWSPIGVGLPDTGRATFTAPDSPGAQVNLRIRASGDPALEHVRAQALPVVARPPAVLVPFGAEWRYAPGPPAAGWSAPGFPDRGWPKAPARFGLCGCLPWEAGTATFLADALETNTAYFRTTFTAPGPASQLDLSVVAESGVVVYLNGQEVLRRNVTDDAPDARATAEGVEVYSLTVPAAHLVEGENTLAAAVKKGSREGVNLTFDLQLTAIPAEPTASGGCGCRAGASAPGGAGLLLAAVAGLGAWRRRARGRRRGPA